MSSRYNAYIRVCFPYGYGGAPRASIYEGKGEPEKSEKVLGNCFTMLTATGIILTLVLSFFSKSVLMAFGADANTIGYAADYLQIYSFGTVFVMITLGMNAFISAQGFTGVSMQTVLIGAVLNIILDPVFIFGMDMGVGGAALATIISQAVSAVWVMAFICGKKTKWHLRVKNLCPRLKVFLPCMALGLSPFIMQSTESLISLCFNTSLRKYGGSIAVGAMTVLSSVSHFALMPLTGLTQGAQPLISYNYGAKNAERVKKAVKILQISCFIYSFTLWALVEIFPELFVLMFNDSPDFIEYTVWALRIYIAALFLFGIQISCQQSFVALGSAVPSIFLALLRKVFLLIPFIYIFPVFFENKSFGVFLAEPCADAISAIVSAVLFGWYFHKKMSEMEAQLKTDSSVLQELNTSLQNKKIN